MGDRRRDADDERACPRELVRVVSGGQGTRVRERRSLARRKVGERAAPDRRDLCSINVKSDDRESFFGCTYREGKADVA